MAMFIYKSCPFLFLENFQPTCVSLKSHPSFIIKYTPLFGGSYQIPKLYIHILCLNLFFKFTKVINFKNSLSQAHGPPVLFGKKRSSHLEDHPMTCKWLWLVYALRIRVRWLKQKNGGLIQVTSWDPIDSQRSVTNLAKWLPEVGTLIEMLTLRSFRASLSRR